MRDPATPRPRDPAALHPAAAAHTRLPAGHAEGFADTFRELYRAVYAAVAAVARSAAEGRWVTVAEELDRV